MIPSAAKVQLYIDYSSANSNVSLVEQCLTLFFIKLQGPTMIMSHLTLKDGCSRIKAEFLVGDSGKYQLEAMFRSGSPAQNITGNGHSLTIDIPEEQRIMQDDLPHCSIKDTMAVGRWIRTDKPIIPLFGEPISDTDDFLSEDRKNMSVQGTYEANIEMDSFRWEYQPFCCKMVYQSRDEISKSKKMRKCFQNKIVTLSGDSLTRLMYYEFINAFEGGIEKRFVHHSLEHFVEDWNLTINLHWIPTLQMSKPLNKELVYNSSLSDYWLLSVGTWYFDNGGRVTRYEPDLKQFDEYQHSLGFKGKSILRNTYSSNFVVQKTRELYNREKIHYLNQKLEKMISENKLSEFTLMDSFSYTYPRGDDPSIVAKDGLHWLGPVSRASTNMIMQYFCTD